MEYVVDKISDGIVLCIDDNNRKKYFQLDECPPELKEGDVIILKDGRCCIDKEATERRQKRIASKFERLKRKEQ